MVERCIMLNRKERQLIKLIKEYNEESYENDLNYKLFLHSTRSGFFDLVKFNRKTGEHSVIYHGDTKGVYIYILTRFKK